MPTPLPRPKATFGRVRPARLRLWLSYAAVALGMLASRTATADIEESTWRRRERPPESPQHVALELRFGPYRPTVDEEFPAARPGPYEGAFGADNKPFYFGVEFDWQFFRIPKLGTLGAGLGWGYTRSSANARFRAPPNDLSAEDTSLAIMPMYGVGVLRVDYLARETVIPLVVYGKAGLGYGLWWSSNNVSTLGKGHTWGTHFALGAMLLLDALDEHSAVELDNEWGINNTYFYVEWMKANLDGFNHSGDHSVLHVGANTWVMGLAIEM